MIEAEFQTPRLLVRRWRDADLPALQATYGDADAMRWVGDGRAITPEECVQWMEVTRANYLRRGYGMFAVELKDAAEVVGFCGIVHPGGQPEPELKYAFLRSCWGRGYATEAVAGLVAYGAGVHRLDLMMATAAPDNLASHRVLLKAGLQRAELRDNGDGTRTQCFRWQAVRGDSALPSAPRHDTAHPMAIDPLTLATLAADFARGMTSIRGRRVQRLLRREFAGADHVLTVQSGAGARAVLGLSASGAAWCATDGRGPHAVVVKWRHGSTQAHEARFDLLKDSLPLLAAGPVALAGVGGPGPLRIATDPVAPRARTLARSALQALA